MRGAKAQCGLNGGQCVPGATRWAGYADLGEEDSPSVTVMDPGGGVERLKSRLESSRHADRCRD